MFWLLLSLTGMMTLLTFTFIFLPHTLINTLKSIFAFLICAILLINFITIWKQYEKTFETYETIDFKISYNTDTNAKFFEFEDINGKKHGNLDGKSNLNFEEFFNTPIDWQIGEQDKIVYIYMPENLPFFEAEVNIESITISYETAQKLNFKQKPIILHTTEGATGVYEREN